MRSETILLVEDNSRDELLTRRALAKVNITNQIEVVRDGAEALDYLFARGKHATRVHARLPVVVLLDLKLPKIGGLEVLEALRAEPRTALLPVVVLTSSDEEQDIVSSYALGANSYVRKPVAFTEFSQAVSQLGLYWTLLNQPPPSDVP